jgi:CHAT domain-containing protein
VRLVTVAVPETPGEADLPGADREVEAVAALLGEPAARLAGQAATREAVLAALTVCTHFHAACHAIAPESDPGAARLLLAGESDPLTAVDVSRLRLRGARMAFLSACATARTGPALADEAVQLASAFQVAGFREVLATMWPVADRITVTLTEGVYRAVVEGRTGAQALHEAARRLRELYPRHPSLWAAYIHTGV